MLRHDIERPILRLLEQPADVDSDEAKHNIRDSGGKKYRGHHARPAKHQMFRVHDLVHRDIDCHGKANDRQRQAEKDGSVQKAGAVADN